MFNKTTTTASILATFHGTIKALDKHADEQRGKAAAAQAKIDAATAERVAALNEAHTAAVASVKFTALLGA